MLPVGVMLQAMFPEAGDELWDAEGGIDDGDGYEPPDQVSTVGVHAKGWTNVPCPSDVVQALAAMGGAFDNRSPTLFAFGWVEERTGPSSADPLLTILMVVLDTPLGKACIQRLVLLSLPMRRFVLLLFLAATLPVICLRRYGIWP